MDSVTEFDVTPITGNNIEIVSPTVNKGGGTGFVVKINGLNLKGWINDLVITECPNVNGALAILGGGKITFNRVTLSKNGGVLASDL